MKNCNCVYKWLNNNNDDDDDDGDGDGDGDDNDSRSSSWSDSKQFVTEMVEFQTEGHGR